MSNTCKSTRQHDSHRNRYLIPSQHRLPADLGSSPQNLTSNALTLLVFQPLPFVLRRIRVFSRHFQFVRHKVLPSTERSKVHELFPAYSKRETARDGKTKQLFVHKWEGGGEYLCYECHMPLPELLWHLCNLIVTVLNYCRRN